MAVVPLFCLRLSCLKPTGIVGLWTMNAKFCSCGNFYLFKRG